MLVNADKSTNICKTCKEDYQKHLQNNVAKTYKNLIETESMILILMLKKSQKLEIDERVEKMQETKAFLTILDHKEGFPHTSSFCLINPSKSDIGKISKSLLDTINENIHKETNQNQWKNTS